MQQVQPPAAIKFVKGPLNGSTFDIVQPITTIGRDKGNDLIVADRKVSRFHARITWNDGSWKIEKLSQTSSITVNQQNTEQAMLYDNTMVELGEDTSFLFLLTLDDRQDDTAEQTRPAPVSVPAEAPVAVAREPVVMVEQKDGDRPLEVALKQPASPLPQGQAVKPPKTEIASLGDLGIPSIEIRDNTSNETQSYPLAQTVINIGRDETNDVVLSEPFISDFHVQIMREDKQCVLIYPHPKQQEMANGLMYQGRRIEGSESFRKPLERGDVFRIADEYGSLVTLTYNDGSGSRQ